MAYTDPNTDITRDKYGNEVVRDPAGTDPRSHTSYWAWAVGAVLAAVLAFALFAGDNTANAPTSSDTTVTQPATPNVPTPAQ